jgi:hypothetical protein
MAGNIFVNGLRVYKPSPKAPDFIIANLELEVATLTEFMNQNANGMGKLRAVIKKSKEGERYYASLDTYQPQQKQEPQADDPLSAIPF